MKGSALNVTLFLLAANIGAVAAQEPMKPSGAAQAMMANDVKDFFETAASSNQLEIEAGKLALQRATDPALKEYARKMIADHGKAGTELEALAKKKGVTLPTKLLGRHQAMLDGLRKEDDGENFDDEYRDKMITSHKEAVSLFDQTAKQSKDADVQAFAAKLLPKLQEHGGMAKALPDH